MMNSVPAVSIDGLQVKRSGKGVLHGISFDVARGQVVGLLGPSGSGKSTLIRSVVGAQIVEGGTITVLGSPAGSPELRHRVGYVTQSPSVYDDLTVTQNLKYFAQVLGAPRSDVARVIDEVDLTEQQRSLVGNLSDGQRSRVSLAAALLGTPELLVLDEPTVGLDPVLRRDLWDLFGLLAARGVTLLVSSHVMDEARRCDRLLLLHDGKLIADETPASVLTRTSTSDHDEAFLQLIGGLAA